ncbi:MATE family efflux transporter [Neopoerus faecalis]|uniref:MATE family efflux transporter n=1 Tax=Neopoerus faecalis TaxID=3032125 RepID=UPI00256FC972|nr:MATE family efflux transporter [Neopoerus faecalis]
MYRDLTHGSITKGLLLFALPMIAGNLLQQLYNIADTLIVGQALGRNALAAVGSAYTLMVFLTSIFLGLSMGAGALFSICLGRGDKKALRAAVAHAFALIGAVTLVLNLSVYLLADPILRFLQIPHELYSSMRDYLLIIFGGLAATFLYNFFACLLRAVGNSVVPLWFLGISALLNIGLDLLFVPVLHFGVAGAAAATVIAQYVSGGGLTLYTILRCRELLPRREDLHFNGRILRELADLSLLTCAQQSAMNFGILLVQRLVDSFGPVIMAAFAAAVKIDSFAYLPVQDFGNAFSTFAAQNYGAGQTERLRQGFRTATAVSAAFSCAISAMVVLFARPLMRIFVQAGETEVLAAGVRYLRIEGAFYAGIGCLFLLYGFYRAVQRPGMSVVLTVISLGTRVALAYALAGPVGEAGIWAAIPIGWFLADFVGYGYYFLRRQRLLSPAPSGKTD